MIESTIVILTCNIDSLERSRITGDEDERVLMVLYNRFTSININDEGNVCSFCQGIWACKFRQLGSLVWVTSIVLLPRG